MKKNEAFEHLPDMELRYIPANLLSSDVEFQRECKLTKVKRIEKDYNPLDLSLVKVCALEDETYGTRYIVIDGQHTVEIIKLHCKNEAAIVPCIVYLGLSYEEAAGMFARQRMNSTDPTGYETTKANREAGDEKAVRLFSIVKAYSYKLGSVRKDYCITATKNLANIVATYGEECLMRELELIADTWDGRSAYLTGPFLTNLARFISTFWDDIDYEQFANRMSEVSFNEIKLEAKTCSASKSVDYTRALYNLYVKKVKRRLDARKLKG